MNPDDEKPKAERDQTDRSLRTERKNTDAAIAAQLSSVEAAADELVEHAREQADAVLDRARDRADEKPDVVVPGTRAGAAIEKERKAEDDLIQGERVAADETLRREREEQAPSLLALLPLEREKTDRYLLTERARSDTVLSNRDDFLGIVSHDLRNLLHGVAMNAMMLSAEATESAEGRRTVEGMKRIQRYVARMNRLIGDLVDIVSIDAGKLAVRPQRGDAAALLTEAVDAFAGPAADKGLTLVAAPAERSLGADFDHDRMLQVLANLISNALKFTGPGGRITVSGARDGEQLRLSVTDTGRGIPADMLEAVFERFRQVSPHEQGGLGLGLHISRCIVEAHGGRIWAESKEGEGSAIHLTIPRAEPPA